MGGEEQRFEVPLVPGAWINVRLRRVPGRELDWAAVLTVEDGGRPKSVCLYDNAHGEPERHRYRKGRKLPGEPVPARGSTRLDLPAAIAEIKANWKGMVERWER